MKPGIPPDTFQTERLLLRRPEAADAAEIFRRWTQDPEVTRYLVWEPHTSIAESEAHISRCRASWADGTAFVWFLEDRTGGGLVGSVASRLSQRGVNLGYLLARDAWGKGLMVEALTPIVEFWLSQPQVFRVWATCDIENRGSQRVLEKAGFQLEGTLRRWDHHPNLSPDPRDALCYSRVQP
jgi:RimJ/RimL family protein N-acetyltransferase